MKKLYAALIAATLFSAPLQIAARVETDRTVHQLFNEYNLAPHNSEDHYINRLLEEYHIAPKANPFSYDHITEVYNELMGESMPLSSTLERTALHEHSHLNNSFFYKDIRILDNPLKVRKHQLNTRFSANTRSELVQAKTEDGETINGTLLDRGSDVLIVVGTGFTNYRERMAPFGDMFTDQDVLFFDFRGHGAQKVKLFKPSTWMGPTQYAFGIDRNKVSFGWKEHLDVEAIVSHVKARKKYKKVVGLGICYSTMMFAKTASHHPELFDKLILDGAWLDLKQTAETISKDVGKLGRPQKHSALANIWPFNTTWFQSTLLTAAEWLLNVRFNTISMLDYLPHLDDRLDVLFFHGKKDALVPSKQFEVIWHATSCPKKTAVVTSNEHVWNHLKSKEYYKEICELFINNSYRTFTSLLTNPSAYTTYKKDMLSAKLER